MSDAPVQNGVIGALKNNCGKVELRDLHSSHKATFWYGGRGSFWSGALAVTEQTVEFSIPISLLQPRIQIERAAVTENHKPGREQ
jgi:hypothetical protein